MDGGMQPIRLTAAEDAKFRKVGAEVAEKTIADLEAKKLPAREAYAMMKALADKHAKTSKNFWVP